jgi:arsenite-transporting ATPase
LNMYGYPVDCVIANRILPDEVKDSYFSGWRKTQTKYMERIESMFSPLPVLKSKLMRSEIVGYVPLEQLGRDIYGVDDPVRVYYEENPQRIVKEGDGYAMVFKLPFAKKAHLEVLKNEDQLTIQIGNYRREVLLPGTLALLKVGKATYEANELKVTFVKGA